MQGIHSARTGVIESDVSDVIAVALAKLRACRLDTLDVFVLLDQLPEAVLPHLAWVAARRAFIPRVYVKTLVNYCGESYLEQHLGRKRARELIANFKDHKQTLSGL